jgi:hypothetical protein
VFDPFRLLVGAPKEKAENLKNVNETGAVYFCPITTATADCSRVDFKSTQTPLEKGTAGSSYKCLININLC